MKKLFVGALIAACLAGCATERTMTMGNRYPPTIPANVKLYLTEKPLMKYEEIGKVSIDKYNNLGISRSGDETYGLLREKAASIGGDAVMNITEDFASVAGVVIKRSPDQPVAVPAPTKQPTEPANEKSKRTKK